MRKTWMVLLTIGLLAAVASAAWADDLTGRIGVGFGGGIYGLTHDRDSLQSGIGPASNAKLGLQLMPVSLKWGIWKYTTLEFANFHYGINKSSLAGEDNFRTTVRPLSLNFLIPLSPDNQFVPYIQLGGGVMFWSNTVQDSVSGERMVATGTAGASNGVRLENTDPMANLGVGFEYFFGGNTAQERDKSFEGRFTYSIWDHLLTDTGLHDNNNRMWMATVGVNFYSKAKGAAVEPGAPIITTESPLPSGQPGTPYSLNFAGSGGTQPYTWSQTAGTLPPGLTLGPDGLLSGTPTTEGDYNFTVQLKDKHGKTATKPFDLGVHKVNPPKIITESVPNGKVGEPYSAKLEGRDGTPPYTWSVIDGAVAPGLGLDAGSGVVSGTPTTAGDYKFTAGLTDSKGLKDTRSYQMSVTAATVEPCDLKEGALEGVYFDFNKADVKPEFNPALNDLAEKLTGACKSMQIRLDGHTDGKGGDAYNMRLGQHRADAVKAYLSQHGVDASRLTTKTFGKRKPIAPNTIKGKDNPDGRAKNRRVEMHIVSQ